MTNTLLDLGGQPLVNNLLGSAQEALTATRWPLKAVYDKNHTIHLDTEVPPEKLYQNYLYRSGISAPYATLQAVASIIVPLKSRRSDGHWR